MKAHAKPPTSTKDESSLLARQAIYEPSGEVYAFELLYRASASATTAVFGNPDDACRETIVSALCDIGLRTLVGSHQAFINISEGMLLSRELSVLPPRQVVIEILEDVNSTEHVRATIQGYKQNGFRIALDDFELDGASGGLVDLADIIKVDVLGKSIEEVAAIVERLKGASNAKLLAEKVETGAEHRAFLELGFDYFQGFYLCRPEIVEKTRIPRHKTTVLNLLGALEDPAQSLSGLETLVQRDATLCYKLLRLLNSSAMGLRCEVSSIGHATVLIGHRRLKRWATLIALAGFDDCPSDLLNLALVRARMCELLGEKVGACDTNPQFTVGLFSALDAMSGLTMSQLVEQMPLVPEVRDALLEGTGELGKMLSGVLDYERGIWRDTCDHGYSAAELAEIYLEAVLWADQTRRSL